jgi:hypothetical protein
MLLMSIELVRILSNSGHFVSHFRQCNKLSFFTIQYPRMNNLSKDNETLELWKNLA